MTKRIALGLQKKDRELVLHGIESGEIVRLPHGEYIEVHEPVDEYERWRLVSFTEYQPVKPRPNAQGKITLGVRLRASLSHWFYEDRISPVRPSELEKAHDHGDEEPEQLTE